MKKTLLAAIVTPVLFAGAAQAAFVESVDGNYADKLDFNGTITNQAPNWVWEIPDASRTKAQDWVLDGSMATREGEDIAWNISARGPIPYFHGHMIAPAPTGQPELTPELTIGGTKIDYAVPKTTITIPAKGTKAGEATPDGALSVILAAGIQDSRTKVGAPYLIPAKSQDSLAQDMAAMISPLASALASAKHYKIQATSPQPAADVLKDLVDPRALDLIGAVSTELSDFKLTFPSATQPDTWTASLPVTVTVK